MLNVGHRLADDFLISGISASCKFYSAKVTSCLVKSDMMKEDLNCSRSFKEIPGPKPLPLIGNSFRFLPRIGEYGDMSVMQQLRKMRETYGDMVRLEAIVNRRPLVFLFSSELCERMYRVQGTWPKRIAIETLNHYRNSRPNIFKGMNGLTVSQGKSWHDFRTKVNQYMMQPQCVRPHVSQIENIADEFINNIRTLRNPRTMEMPESFNNEVLKWALESMFSIAMNSRLGCLKPNLSEDSEPQTMINCVHDMFELMYQLEILPSMWKIYNTPNLKKFFRIMDKLNEITVKYVNLAKVKIGKEPTKHLKDKSVLEKLVEIDELTGHVMAIDMLTAGIDTTGNSSLALLYYLACNQDKQEKLREEILKVMPNGSSPITLDILNKMSYLRACIKESLRLFPISIGTLRTMQSDVVINGYKLPKGIDVVACHSILSMDPQQFPQPQEYIPERWLRNNVDYPLAKNAHPFAYMPFGFGVRTCIGRRFAELEMEVLLLKMLSNFRMEWHHEPLQYASRFINTVVSPLKLRLFDL
ncbi:hypothetical protein KM043_016927 [Ampulex compressa]|nr:hypothetical protein KM043_016927 [Ampulex compressa]